MVSRLDELILNTPGVGTGDTDAIKTGPGVLVGVVINPSAATSAFDVIDDVLAAGGGSILVSLASVITTAGGGTPSYIPMNVSFTDGLSVNATTGTPSYTVLFR